MSEKRDGVEFLTKVLLDYYLTKSGLKVFGFCPAGSTNNSETQLLGSLEATRLDSMKKSYLK